MRRRALLGVALALLIASTLGLGTMTPAPAQEMPIGAWEVRHGQLGEEFIFAQSGQYYYRRYSAQFGSLTTQAEENGTFTVQGSRLILRPSQKAVRTLRWRIGTHVTALPGEPVLYLSDESGDRERMFYRK